MMWRWLTAIAAQTSQRSNEAVASYYISQSATDGSDVLRSIAAILGTGFFESELKELHGVTGTINSASEP
jgi:hypothetical protein